MEVEEEQQQPKEERVDLHVCVRCYTLNRTMLKCGRCRRAHYCGKECQKSHWEAHRTECVESAVQVDDRTLLMSVRLARLPQAFPQEEFSAVDSAIIKKVERAGLLACSYRFVARGAVCGGAWLVGELHCARRGILSAAAIKLGRWIFAMEKDQAGSEGYCLTAFLANLHAHFVRVDALPHGLSAGRVLLEWLLLEVAPLTDLPQELRSAQSARNLDDIVCYEFTHRGPVPAKKEDGDGDAGGAELVQEGASTAVVVPVLSVV